MGAELGRRATPQGCRPEEEYDMKLNWQRRTSALAIVLAVLLASGVAIARQAAAAMSGAIGFAQIEGYWVAAGGRADVAPTMAAIALAESGGNPGAIQQGVAYCGSGSNRTGWGLWQITCGNSVPAYCIDFAMLDPWNNAEAAVAKFKAQGLSAWATYTSGAYKRYLPMAPPGPDGSVTDPGQFVPRGSPPPGSQGVSQPGATCGPVMASGVLVASTSPDGTLYIKQGLWGTWQAHTAAGQSKAVAISPDGSEIASVTPGNTLYIKQGLWGTWQQHTAAGDAQAVALGPNGMVGDVTGCGAVYIKTTLWGTWQQHMGCGQAKAIAISPDGQIIAVVRPDNTLVAKQGLWGAWQTHTAVGDSLAAALGPNGMVANVNTCGALYVKTSLWGAWQ